MNAAIRQEYDVIVIGGGHAGAEAAWAAANLGAAVAMVTMDPAKIGAMSCNPAMGGLAKGQMIREIDALDGLMGLAADRTGIQFRMLNASKGPAVQGPRSQNDKYRYAQAVQELIASRDNIDVIAGMVDDLIVEGGRCVGAVVSPSPARAQTNPDTVDPRVLGASPYDQLQHDAIRLEQATSLRAGAVILTTGTFMRGLMHTGERQVEGGRIGEGAAVGISATLRRLGFALGRLKTGTPPRLDANTIDWDRLELQPGDDHPEPFSDLTDPATFPPLPQRPCHVTHTTAVAHEAILANLERAPMYNGQIETAGPRYCPSIEDKVVRFSDRASHHVFLEPESLDTEEIYCNGISTSLPSDVQDVIVRELPGCERATILKYGYAVEYDMVWPHQIDATCMTKRIAGLFLAGQINGTSGYEEAGGQGLIAGLNAVRLTRGESLKKLRRDEAYIGVLLDDLVTKTPREPYRMFTSRAEFRLTLRSDNADARLTPMGRSWGLVGDDRWSRFQARKAGAGALERHLRGHRIDGKAMSSWVHRPDVSAADVLAALEGADLPGDSFEPRVVKRVLADHQYAGYIERQQREVAKLNEQESQPLPVPFEYGEITGLRNEAAATLTKFQPTTFGQAARLAGVTPADLMVVSVAMKRRKMAVASG